MKDDEASEVPMTPDKPAEHQQRRDLRRAVTFGVILATVEMGFLLYFMYC